MNDKKTVSLYFISVASTLYGIHPQTIRTYEEKGLIKPYRTKGGTRRYSQEDVDKLIQIANLSQRGINLDGVKCQNQFLWKWGPLLIVQLQHKHHLELIT